MKMLSFSLPCGSPSYVTGFPESDTEMGERLSPVWKRMVQSPSGISAAFRCSSNFNA